MAMNSGSSNEKATVVLRRDIDIQLDLLEKKIKDLQILFEQYFNGIQPFAPDQEKDETKTLIRFLLKSPFKNSQSNFRLQTLIQRFNTHATYWERVQKQKDAGTYSKDIFKAGMRAELKESLKNYDQKHNPDAGLKQLYKTYKEALEQVSGKGVDFDTFKATINNQAHQIRQSTGATKVSFKVVVKDNKVVLKASS